MAVLFEEEITKYPVSPPVVAALESFVHVVIALWYPSPVALSFSLLHLSLCLSFRLLVLRVASRCAMLLLRKIKCKVSRCVTLQNVTFALHSARSVDNLVAVISRAERALFPPENLFRQCESK